MADPSSFEDWLETAALAPVLDRRPIKRSVTIAGHATSISLEPMFWQGLQALAQEQGRSLASLVAAIDRIRGDNGLPSAIRQVLYARASERSEKRFSALSPIEPGSPPDH